MGLWTSMEGLGSAEQIEVIALDRTRPFEASVIATVSLAHITEKDYNLLKLMADPKTGKPPELVTYDMNDGGVMVYINKQEYISDMAEAANTSISPQFLNLYSDVAVTGNYDWLWFHCDGPEVDGYTTFDW